ncbi:MAG: S-adenosyl-l-methionine hydroxide adenosyltransferase family protein [bacterium]
MQKESDIKPNILVFMSDFGLSDRFVASMKGVALQVDRDLKLHDLTHLIEPFNIWEAAQTLSGTVVHWPKGTVFVSVVDPGVGTSRKSVVVRTKSGHFIVTPDNGTLTLVADEIGLAEVREIDENANRRPGSEEAATFHGRDVYAYTGARLAAGVITFEQVGPVLEQPVVKLPYQAAQLRDGVLTGSIVKIERPYGNVVTNIPLALATKIGLNAEKMPSVQLELINGRTVVLRMELPFVKSFGYVERAHPLLYPDSNGMLGLAVNGGSFAQKFGVESGMGWSVRISKGRRVKE